MPKKCKYKYLYIDRGIKTYVCEEDAVKDGLCIFHHPEYWREHEDEVRKKFMEKVEDASNNKKPLFCISYNLPKINLSKKKFEAPVYFAEAIFHEGAKFCEAEFSSAADFSDVAFLSVADFFRAKFQYIVDFAYAKFSEADFSRVTFSSRADFSGAMFSLADFSATTFLSRAEFGKTTFSSRADFFKTKFSEANFFGAWFSEAYFIGATFSGAVAFDGVKFLGEVLFNQTTFLDAVSFVDSDFSPDVLEKSLDPYNCILFKHANFEMQERVVFDGCNMERVSFICTDLERIKFRNVKWKNFKIYDEKLFLLKRSKEEARGKSDKEKEKNLVDIIIGEDLTLDNVLAIYRALRENYDYCLRYDESGKFFVNEMRLKKRLSNFVEKIIMSAYELLCLYGESYTRTIIWILATISLFALARLYMNAPIDSLDSLKISTAAFFQLYYNSDPLTLTERLISIPILGSLYISLKRKLERKIRH